MSRFVRLPKSGNYVDASLIRYVEAIGGGGTIYEALTGKTIPSGVIVHFLGDLHECIRTETIAQAQDIRDEIMKAVDKVEDKPPASGPSTGFFDDIAHLEFTAKLAVLGDRCQASPDPFVKWVGDHLFHATANRAYFLDAKSPEEFDERDEAAHEAKYNEAVEKGRILGSGSTFAPDCGN
jgi:hypothetical protein